MLSVLALNWGGGGRTASTGHHGAPHELRTPVLRLCNCPGQVAASLSSSPSLPPSLSLALLCVSRDPCSVLFLNETLCPPLFSHLLLPRFTTVGSPRFNPNGSPRFDPNGSQRITTYYHKRDATFRLVSPHSRFDPGRLRSTHPRSAVTNRLTIGSTHQPTQGT